MCFIKIQRLLPVKLLEHMSHSVPPLRYAAASLQMEGQRLILLETNKAWGACGELVSRKHLCSKTDPSLHLLLSEGKECQECGLFQETSARLPPLGHTPQDGWWESEISQPASEKQWQVNQVTVPGGINLNMLFNGLGYDTGPAWVAGGT